MVALFAVGAYRGVWRYFGLMDAVIFARAVAAGTIVAVAALAFLYRLENYSRGVFIIYAAIALLALTGSRASFRLISEFVQRRRAGERLLVYGAGDAGALVVRELLRNTQRPCRMLGFIDDDPAKQSRSVHGYAVLGGYDRLVSLAESRAVDRIVISARVIDGEKLRCVERLCAENDISLSRLHIRLEHLISP
jgi:UDP-GlcNAc:undecaprenyl-phosphate/decaprenyl-phosphate GlcNAc-1-phosphate transferase